MLTAPWSLADYIGQDGGQVLTGQSNTAVVNPMSVQLSRSLRQLPSQLRDVAAVRSVD